MSSPTLDTTNPPAAARRPWVAAVVAVAATGPLAVAAVRAILPYETVDDTATALEKIQAAPAAASAVQWLVLLAAVTLPLAVAIVGRFAMRVRPVLGTLAATIAWLGYVTLFAVAGIDQLAPAAAQAGLSSADAVALVDASAAHPTAGLALMLFIVGHILGTVLLGIVLWRAVPRWAALALIVSPPLHLVFAVIVPVPGLDALAWALTAAGFATAAYVSAVTAP